MITAAPVRNICLTKSMIMKHILFAIAVMLSPALIYSTSSANSMTGIEPKSLSHHLPSQEPLVMDCNVCNKKVYLIPIKRNCCKQIYYVIVENKSTGEQTFKKIIERDLKNPIPDLCYFTCDYDTITY